MGQVIALGYEVGDATRNGVLVDALERATRAVKWLAQRQFAVLGIETTGRVTRIVIKPCGRCRQLRSVYTKRGRCLGGFFETRVALLEHCEVTWTNVQTAPFHDVAPAPQHQPQHKPH